MFDADQAPSPVRCIYDVFLLSSAIFPFACHYKHFHKYNSILERIEYEFSMN